VRGVLFVAGCDAVGMSRPDYLLHARHRPVRRPAHLDAHARSRIHTTTDAVIDPRRACAHIANSHPRPNADAIA